MGMGMRSGVSIDIEMRVGRSQDLGTPIGIGVTVSVPTGLGEQVGRATEGAQRGGHGWVGPALGLSHSTTLPSLGKHKVRESPARNGHP